MNLVKYTLTPVVGVANGIAVSQTTGGATNLVLAGSLTSGGVATFAVPRKIAIAATGNLSAITFAVIGTDRYGNAQSVAIAGPNNSTVTTTQDFATVTQVSVSAAVTAVTVGTSTVTSTPWYVGDWHHNAPIFLHITLSAGAVMTYTVEQTATNLNDGSIPMPDRLIQAQNPIVENSTDATVVAASTNEITNFIVAPPGSRVTVNTYTSGTLTAVFAATSGGIN